MKTSILSGRQAQEALLRGVNKMADTVGISLGPLGRNVAIARTDYKGTIYKRDVIHDGVKIAKSINLENEDENMGAQILLEAAQKQVDQVGDGTTVVMVLAQAIVNEYLKMVSTGVNPMILRKGLERGVEKLTKRLKKLGKSIKTLDDLKFIATVSAQDPKLGEMVAEVFDKVGKDGVVTVEESKGAETVVDHQTGMQFDKGWINEYFVNNPETMEATIQDAHILVTDKPITQLVQLTTFFNEFVGEKHLKNLVIISPDISGEALPLLIKNRMELVLNVSCIKAPSFGKNQKDILYDIAILTGGKFITEDAGHKFEDVKVADLGQAEYVTSGKLDTIIIGGKGKKSAVDARIASIKKQLDDEESDFERAKLRERLAKLTNGVVVIKVGGQTEIEMKERYERVDDAVAATRAAMQGGIVPGGERVYSEIKKVLDKSDIAERVLYDALSKPFQKLIANAGISEADAAVALADKDYTHGIDVLDGKVKDFMEAGIVDPLLVPFNALQNAVSVSIQLATTEANVNPIIKEDGKNV